MRAQTKRVIIYTTPICPWCDTAKRYCADNGVEFTEIDVESDRTGLREMALMTGQRGVPVLRVGEKAMIGWNAAEFQRLMGWDG